jgi:apolipoprotein N-acyltransferase
MLAAPVVWAGSEWARLVVTGVGWNALGYSQAFQPAVIQSARWGGVYLVSAIMVAASTALVFSVVYLEHRRGVVVLTLAGALAVASVLYGESLRSASDQPGSITVAAIQPNIPIDGAWDDPNFVDQMMLRLISLSERAVQDFQDQGSSSNAEKQNGDSTTNTGRNGSAGIDLVIWPESPMSFEYDRDEALRRGLAEFTRRNNVYLLMNSWGFPDRLGEGQPSEGQYNSAVVISPSGEKTTEYDKMALVPFGEFVPARGWIPFMDRIPALVADIAPGKELKLIDAAGARLGASICFEVTRPDLARRMRLGGATSLVQISNELWFGASSEPRQMLAEAVFRAVENGVELVRVTNSGLSARISSYGIVSGETPLLEIATRVWKIKSVEEARDNELTFYTRRGDVFAVGCVIASLVLFVASFVRKRGRLWPANEPT